MRFSHVGTRGSVAQLPFHSPVRAPRSVQARAGELPAAHPRDRESLVAGPVYVAPPDRHLLLHDDMLRLTVGPWENEHRSHGRARTLYGCGDR